MLQRFEQSAVRLLRNIFRVGLFENPYLDVAETEKTVGNPEFMQAGFDAQLKSVVLLKNKQKTLPLQKQLKVYVPKKYTQAGSNWFGQVTPESWKDAANPEVVKKYFELVDAPEKADVALVFIESPKGGTGYSRDDVAAGGNGYVPINLQYNPYKAEFARETSIAGGSTFEDFTNRSYKGKTGFTANIADLKAVTETKKQMGGKPVITIVDVANPLVFAELEPSTDAILVHFGVQDQAIMEIITGGFEPFGLLPFQMPASMKTVDEQLEDAPRDMECFTDSEGNTYDFAFGLNWSGIISNERGTKYK